MVSVLIDPDSANEKHIDFLTSRVGFDDIDFIFVGGSLVTDGNIKNCVQLIKNRTSKPIVLFPGSPNQIEEEADGILLLSLISGVFPIWSDNLIVLI